MDIVRRLISVVSCLALSISLIGVGFLACLSPFVTTNLANTFADDAASPFNRSQLVQVADATRDYAFGSHDKLALYRTITQVDLSYQQSIEQAGGKVASDFPDLHTINESSTEAQYRSAFRNASDVYCYTESEITHLDDCYTVYIRVIPFLIIAALATAASFIAVGVMGKKRHLGGVLMAGGIAVIALLILLALWAFIDFNGFFASFHTFFFAQGTWSFPANSLLICALPLGFWIGMAIVWLVATLVGALICLFFGRFLRKH